MRVAVLAVLGLLVASFLLFTSQSFENPDYVTGGEYNRYVLYTVSTTDLPSGVNGVVLTLPSDVDPTKPFVFTDSTGRILPVVYFQDVPYWIETDGSGNPSYVWIRVPYLPAGSTVYVYAVKDPSRSPDGYAVFDFFDDFDSGTLDVTRWQDAGSNCYKTVTPDGELRLQSVMSNIFCVLISRESFSPGEVFGSRVYIYNGNPGVSGYGVSIGMADPTLGGYSVDVYVFTIGWYSAMGYYFWGYDTTQNRYVGSIIDISQYISSPRWVVTSAIWKPDGYVDVYLDYQKIGDTTAGDPITVNMSPRFASGPDPTYVLVDWVYVTRYDPNVSVLGVTPSGSGYVIAIRNNGSTTIYDYAVSIPAASLDVTSPNEGISFAAVTHSYSASTSNRVGVVLSDVALSNGYVFLFYNGDSNTAVYSPVVMSYVAGVPYTLGAPSDVSLYPGYAVVGISPDDTAASDKNITITLYTDSPFGIGYSECVLEYNMPVSGTYNRLVSDSNTNVVSFTVTMNEEGVYVFDYNCSVFLTEPISGSFTHTVIIPDPTVPSLSVTHDVPIYLTTEQNVTVTLTVTSDGTPVEGVTCYIEQNDVYTGTTDVSGTAVIEAVLGPGDVSLSCFKVGYHPYFERFTILSSAPTPPLSGGGGGGTYTTTTTTTTTTEQTTDDVQPSTTDAPSQLSVSPINTTFILGLLVVGVILYLALRRR